MPSENGSQTILAKEEIRRARKKSGLSASRFAQLFGLKSRYSLLHYENGSKPISRRFARRFLEWRDGYGNHVIVAKVFIPEGTILPDNAEVAICAGCNRKFIRLNRRRRFHSRKCQLKVWRAERRRDGRSLRL